MEGEQREEERTEQQELPRAAHRGIFSRATHIFWHVTRLTRLDEFGPPVRPSVVLVEQRVELQHLLTD